MVTTVTSHTASRYAALVGTGYDGVVRISSGGYYGTGILLYDGQAILTAAHLFRSGTDNTSIHFETSGGNQSLTPSKITILSTYDALNGNDDLALLWLPTSAPISADRYELYRHSDEIGQTFTMVGYGLAGTGDLGTLSDSPPIRLKANNQMDMEAAALKDDLGRTLSWTPSAGSQFVADFDNGLSSQDALGRLVNISGLGLGQDEGLIAPGDSGGPAFIGGKAAGIASYVASLSLSNVTPDVDNTTNSSFGELGFWQRISYHQQWIDDSLRANYPDAPSKPEEVQTSIHEGNSGTSHTYFILQFTGVRGDPNQTLSVDFSTRDGTAHAGQDYLATNGTLMLYPDENQAVIPVEVIGDTVPEPDEAFYLDVTNPQGGSFGQGVVQLTAMRAIINDDGSVLA